MKSRESAMSACAKSRTGEKWPEGIELSTTSSSTSRRCGVGHIFGVDGANIEDLYDAAFFRDDITAVLAKHEFSAATMADGYSRSGAGLGVVAATSGGGALNTVPGWERRSRAGCRCWR